MTLIAELQRRNLIRMAGTAMAEYTRTDPCFATLMQKMGFPK